MEDGEQEENTSRMELSMNTIGGSVSDNTIKLKGQMKGKPILALIDSGNTPSFVDGKTVGDLKLELTRVAPMTVAIADGCNLVVKVKCTGCV